MWRITFLKILSPGYCHLLMTLTVICGIEIDRFDIYNDILKNMEAIRLIYGTHKTCDHGDDQSEKFKICIPFAG